MSYIEVGDCVEEHLRVEIVSDTPEKVECARKAICDLILEIPAHHDVMVTMHDCTPKPKGEHDGT